MEANRIPDPPTGEGYSSIVYIKTPSNSDQAPQYPPTGSNIKVVFKIWFTIIAEVAERRDIEK